MVHAISTATRARRPLVAVAVMTALATCYALAYGLTRNNHDLVRYSSGCVVRGGLEGHARDFWIWPYRCSELRRYLAPSTDAEIVFAPLITVEELARGPHVERPSVCSLPVDLSGFPSQGLTRPAWCGP